MSRNKFLNAGFPAFFETVRRTASEAGRKIKKSLTSPRGKSIKILCNTFLNHEFHGLCPASIHNRIKKR
jgi:hypothetical protein